MSHEANELQRLRTERRLLLDAKLELRAQEAAAWQAFCVSGVHTPNAERSRLKAALTKIDLELHRKEARINAINMAVNGIKGRTLLAHLSEVLRERQLEDVWHEARRRMEAQSDELVAQAMASVNAQEADENQQRQALLDHLMHA
jgi:hypothetical protein